MAEIRTSRTFRPRINRYTESTGHEAPESRFLNLRAMARRSPWRSSGLTGGGEVRVVARQKWRWDRGPSIWLRPQLYAGRLENMPTDEPERQEPAKDQDVQDLRAHVQQFVRRFGLLVTRQTPCGFPVSPSYAHALMVLLHRTSAGLATLQSDLAAGLGIDKSNVARLSERMVRAGHALQSVPPADGRSRIVTLTPKGARVAQRIEQGSRDRFSAVAGRIPARKRRAVIAALADLNAAVAGIAGENHP
jgi:DNA-binding MarR family transcriptional regulator